MSLIHSYLTSLAPCANEANIAVKICKDENTRAASGVSISGMAPDGKFFFCCKKIIIILQLTKTYIFKCNSFESIHKCNT